MDHRVVSTLLEVLRAAGGPASAPFTPGEFCYRWHTELQPGVAPVLNVWRDGAGQAVAFAWLSDGLLHLVHRPDREALLTEMLDWGEAVAYSGAADGSLQIMAGHEESSLRELLAARGYRPADLTLVRYVRPLMDLPRLAPLQPGYRLRQVDSEDLSAAWAAAYTLAFDPESVSPERRRAVEHGPLYRPDLDLVARPPDGAVAAFALAWFDPETRSGAFEPVGCVPAHRRRGLTRALMLAGLGRLRELGAERAYVTTARRRAPANRLYASIGFRECHRSGLWARPA